MELKIGTVEDYFSHAGAIALTLEEELNVGDTIHVRGHTTDLTQRVESMQVDHQPVTTAKASDGVGIKITGKARKGDTVYKMVS